jgi:hypothetical protein
MNDQTTLQSIARSGHGRILPYRPRGPSRTPEASHSKRASGLLARLWYNHISPAVAMSVTLTNTEKQARYRERHLGVDGEKVASGSNSTPTPERERADLHTTVVIH